MAKAARAEADEEGSERTCIVTREKHSPDDMIRFVLGPEAQVAPDLRRKLPGRGVWVSCSAKKVDEAVRKQAFGRGFKTQAKASPDLAAEVDRLLERDALEGLSIANKAGLIVSGAAKVEAAIEKDWAMALIHATDGGPDGVRKIDQAVARRFGTPAAIEKWQTFASGQLDLALGRTNVIHAAVKRGAAGELFLSRCRRLVAYRTAGTAAAEATRAAERTQRTPGDPEPQARDDGLEAIAYKASGLGLAADEKSNGLGPGIES